MKKFALNLGLFLSLNALIPLFFLTIIDARYTYRNGETESNLFIIPRHQSYDILLMGASHGRIFSRDNNHLKVEKMLSGKILNISKGGGGGIVPEKLYLSYFFERGNTAKKILYIIDPWIFYSPLWNEKNYFLDDEPLRFSFIPSIVSTSLDKNVRIRYLTSKLSYRWILKKPSSSDENNRRLLRIDPLAVDKRRKSLYPDGLQNKYFARYKKDLEDILRLAHNNNTSVIFIYPPTLLGDMPGSEEVKKLLLSYEKTERTAFYDFSGSIKKPTFYSDHDHLNTNGIMYFTEHYLKNILSTYEAKPPTGKENRRN